MRKFNIVILWILCVPVILIVLFLFKLTPQETSYKTVKISDVSIKAEVADTPLKQMVGLMGKSSLPKNQGMIFIFDDEGYPGIWMMNTSISLDIIWIDSNHKVVDIVKNAQPCFLICEIYKPDKPARYVLEVNAGFTDRNSVKIGSVVKF